MSFSPKKRRRSSRLKPLLLAATPQQRKETTHLRKKGGALKGELSTKFLATSTDRKLSYAYYLCSEK